MLAIEVGLLGLPDHGPLLRICDPETLPLLFAKDRRISDQIPHLRSPAGFEGRDPPTKLSARCSCKADVQFMQYCRMASGCDARQFGQDSGGGEASRLHAVYEDAFIGNCAFVRGRDEYPT